MTYTTEQIQEMLPRTIWKSEDHTVTAFAKFPPDNKFDCETIAEDLAQEHARFIAAAPTIIREQQQRIAELEAENERLKNDVDAAYNH